MMSGLVFSFVVMFGKDRTALRVREDPFGGRDIMVLICLGSARCASFSKSEFEIGICIEIGILPEHSEANNIFKINSWDSRDSDDQ